MFEVYAHTSPSGKHYVGWTSKGSDARWASHVKAARAGSPLLLHRSIRKYGAGAFTHTLLERMTTEAGAKQAEKLWIRELGAFTPGGYNLTLGGDGISGMPCSPETRAKISRANSGCVITAETRAKISAANKGRKLSPETIARQIAARTGSTRSAETRARISLASQNRTPEYRAKASASRLGKPLSGAHRASLCAAWVRRKAKP